MLLIPLCYIQFGYYGQFIVQRWRVQQAAREAWLASLPDSAFVRLSLSSVNAAGKWEEEGRECRYNGHLYDVIRQRTAKDVIWLFCLDDEREERLIDASVDVTKANQDLPVNSKSYAHPLSIGDLFCETPQWVIPQPATAGRQFNATGRHPLLSRHARIVIPPPKYPSLFFC
ncbi:MAG TPA: hypothetical protein VHE54_18300 [Puia sp.]|nr:hypothetical protein [Puia sp.]